MMLREELEKIQLEFSKKEQEVSEIAGSEKALLSRKLEMKEVELEMAKTELKSLKDEKNSLSIDLESTQRQALELVQSLQVTEFSWNFLIFRIWRKRKRSLKKRIEQ
jgi:hypothetical protein